MFLCSEGKDLESQDASFEFQIYNGHLLCHAAKDPSYRLYYMNKVTHKAILLWLHIFIMTRLSKDFCLYRIVIA